MSREITKQLLESVEEGIIDKDQLIIACLEYMSEDEVLDMARINGLLDDKLLDDAEDGQPDEAQEWADFDPDC